ncbi:endoplasmic reticulum-based factor for assembly of V-ATPase-domain-containing protein [Chaetomium fimeti]|uniref:Endoplasmic reticulum-based factor for assembly of V-ATPase-domain-containing protein n=1 Tax=Chaetomium fimeti TaxID=1854472 RepID=A0AAE0H6I0_9PEZI|nr:endoplasmic reticulum-based factor for assembly of V-ATPase-domain-containing protein [Chaetomium fimeti]
MTPRIVAGLQSLSKPRNSQNAAARPRDSDDSEPSLEGPAVGNPVTHSQIVDIWKTLNDIGCGDYTLEELLKGSKVYVPPPAPKSEPSDDYKALMARLRREQEQREYERMANPLPPMETFSQRYPNGANMAQAFAAVNRPTNEADMGDDDVTYNDVHRQLMLILNFVASILGVAATLWIVARWWSTPARLFLTMGGSLLVGIAEIAVYSGYVWHLGQADKKDKTLKEVKEVLQTWTVGVENEAVVVGGEPRDQDANLRQRQKGHR